MGVSTKKAQTKKKSPGQIIQKLFLSEYFILYLTILCFVCVIPFQLVAAIGSGSRADFCTPVGRH